jgi:RNA polymerase sigma-70 factor (ECF subfamily)
MSKFSRNVFTQCKDTDLILFALKRNSHSARAYATLFHRYQTQLAAYLSAVSQLDPSIIEDLIQEIYLRTWDNLESLQDHTKYYSWMLTIARNLMMDHLREEKRQNNIASVLFDHLSTSTPNHKMDSVDDWLSALSIEEREIVLLKVIFEFSFSEIAEMNQISESATKMRFYRTIEKLKD